MKYFVTVSTGLLEKQHQEKMQLNKSTSCIWMYLWFLDKITKIEDSLGVVLGGKPIKLEDIELWKDIKTTRAVFQKLEKEGYIVTRRTPYGRVVWVTKAKKIFGQKVPITEVPQDGSSLAVHGRSLDEKGGVRGRSGGVVRGRSNKTRQLQDKETEEAIASEDSFSFEEELEKLRLNDKRKDLKIIAHYWKKKGWTFENKIQFNAALRRELVPAKALTGYTGEQVGVAITYCEKNYEVWTLETVGKRITDLINKK